MDLKEEPRLQNEFPPQTNNSMMNQKKCIYCISIRMSLWGIHKMYTKNSASGLVGLNFTSSSSTWTIKVYIWGRRRFIASVKGFRSSVFLYSKFLVSWYKQSKLPIQPGISRESNTQMFRKFSSFTYTNLGSVLGFKLLAKASRVYGSI